jgi:hypothetical protein
MAQAWSLFSMYFTYSFPVAVFSLFTYCRGRGRDFILPWPLHFRDTQAEGSEEDPRRTLRRPLAARLLSLCQQGIQ